VNASEGPGLEIIKELLRKLDEVSTAGAKLRTTIAGQMSAAHRGAKPAKDDTAVVVARRGKTSGG
jgi:hypothetical protein